MSLTKDLNNENGGIILKDFCSDSIQKIKFNNNSNDNLLGCASWNCNVMCYSIELNKIISINKHNAPVMNLCWNNNNLYSCSCDKTIKMYNPTEINSKSIIIGSHSKPIKELLYSKNHNYIISGGWDNKLKFWDPKYSSKNDTNNNNNPKCIGEIKLNERVYSMDLNNNLLSVGLGSKKINIYDLRNPNKIFCEIITSLKHQIRCISNFNDETGLGISSVEGRCYIAYINNNKNNFSFKCHQNNNKIYSVNSIKFNKKYNDIFITGGSDGIINIWNKSKKILIKQYNNNNNNLLPIMDIDFNYDNTLFGYATSYDWSKGIQYFKPNKQKPSIYIHKICNNQFNS